MMIDQKVISDLENAIKETKKAVDSMFSDSELPKKIRDKYPAVQESLVNLTNYFYSNPGLPDKEYVTELYRHVKEIDTLTSEYSLEVVDAPTTVLDALCLFERILLDACGIEYGSMPGSDTIENLSLAYDDVFGAQGPDGEEYKKEAICYIERLEAIYGHIQKARNLANSA